MTKHPFGGEHTEYKLAILRAYMEAYQVALSKQMFKTIYFDAFAGTGSRTVKTKANPLFNEEAGESEFAGSAKIALEIKNPFDHYIFCDNKKSHYKALLKLKKNYPDLSIECKFDDANQAIEDFSKYLMISNARAVAFLDPYGLQLKWASNQILAKTQKVDVLILVSLSGLYRQAANKMEDIDEDKAKSLDEFLGNDEWRHAFYETEPDLFNHTSQNRTLDWRGINKFVKEKLETIFEFVEDPIVLPKNKGAPLFSLFYAMSNPNPKAIGLGKKLFKHLKVNL